MQKLAEICVRRPVFATMLIAALVVVGVFSYGALGVDLFPKIDLPTITVTTVNPGASPQEIETEVTDRVEATVNTISGIDEMRSTSVEGVSQVFITFLLEKNPDIAAQEVRDKVNLIVPDLPETAETPTVQKLDTDAQPIVAIVVSADMPMRELTTIADKKLKERLETVNGVGEVQIIGGQEREIQVMANPDRLRAYKLSINDVANALRTQNVEVPGGRVDLGPSEMTVRTAGRVTDPNEFRNIIVATRGAYNVKVGDVAEVVDGAVEQRTVSVLNGVPAVTLLVTKQSGSNTVAVADGVKERLAEITPFLPKGVTAEVVRDQSVFIRAAINRINEHLILGALFAAAVVFLFLWNFRSTVISALAIPTSIIATFALMNVMGYTLNSMTMLSLTLMVGIVIDDAIVVLENIFRFIEEKGMAPFDAAIEGTREIGPAVMATTLSLLAVFVPVGFMAGIVGRFMSSFGLTAAFAIAVSLLVSFTLTPMLAARWIKPNQVKHGDHDSKHSHFYHPIEATYMVMLRWSMRHRWVVVLACVLVIVSIYPLFWYVGKNFLPSDDQAQFEVTVRAPEGSTVTATSLTMERIAREVRELPGVELTLTTLGGGQQQLVNSGTIFVKLVPIENRNLDQFAIMSKARALLANHPSELRTSVQPVAAISGGGFRNADIQFVIGGPDLAKLTDYSDKLVAKLKTIKDVVDADTSLVTGKPELRIEINRQKAADLGVRVADIATALNTLVGGTVVTTFNEGTDQYDVRLRAASEFRASPEEVRRLSVPSTRGPVGLENVVTYERATGPSAIDRLNRQRQVTLTSNVKPGGSQSAVIAELQAYVKELNIDAGYSTGLAGRAKELGRAGYYFMLAISLSFIFMYMVLAAQFESFIHPITILMTLPLAVPFGIVSLLVAGQTVNIFSGLGLLLLFGIVKKNAILQIDHTNGLRVRGMPRLEAILQANKDRLRPILMTTLALVVGMIPLVAGTGPGSATNRSIGVLVVGGQSLCLLLTLLAVPVFYSIFEDIREVRFGRRIRLSKWGRVVFNEPGRWSESMKRTIAVIATLSAVLAATVPSVRAQSGAALASPSLSEPGAVATGLSSAPDSPGDTPVLSVAQDPAQAPIAREPRVLIPEARIGVDESNPLPISLATAIEMALVRNRDIEVERITTEQTQLQVDVARGAFDPLFRSTMFYENRLAPVASSIGGNPSGITRSHAVSASAGLSKLFDYGTVIDGSFSQVRSDTDNIFLVINPQYQSDLVLNFRQPLLRNRGSNEASRRLRVARAQVDLSDALFRQKVIETVGAVQRAYWDLEFALKGVTVARESVGLAETQIGRLRRLVQEGISAPVEIVQVEAELERRRQNLLSTIELVTLTENTLKSLILSERANDEWNRPLVPTDSARVVPVTWTIDDAVKTAIENRPELAQLRTREEINNIDLTFFRGQTKPQVDLVASYGSTGLAGTATLRGNPFNTQNEVLYGRVNQLSLLAGLDPLVAPTSQGVAPVLVGGYGKSLENLFSQDFRTVRVGIEIGWNVTNRIAEANLGIAEAEGRKIAAQRQALEQRVEREVRNALQVVQSARQKVEAAKAAREASEVQLQSEQRRFEAGLSTTYFVLERQNALSEARAREISTLTEFNKALSELQRFVGVTLSANAIEMSDVKGATHQ